MANSIDWTVLGLGALVGVGCRKQIRLAGRVVAQAAAGLAGAAATAAQQVAKETSPEAAAEEQGNGQAGQNGQGH